LFVFCSCFLQKFGTKERLAGNQVVRQAVSQNPEGFTFSLQGGLIQARSAARGKTK
jgi:hypothetical protein